MGKEVGNSEEFDEKIIEDIKDDEFREAEYKLPEDIRILYERRNLKSEIKEYREKLDKENKLEPYKKTGQYKPVIGNDKGAIEENKKINEEILQNDEETLKERVKLYNDNIKRVDTNKKGVAYLAYTQALGELREFYEVKVENLQQNMSKYISEAPWIIDSQEEKAKEIGKKSQILIKAVEKEDEDLNEWLNTARKDGLENKNASFKEMHNFYFNKLKEKYPNSLALKILETQDENQKNKYIREQEEKIEKIQKYEELQKEINEYNLKLYATEAQIWHNRAEELKESEPKKEKSTFLDNIFLPNDPENKAVTKYQEALNRAALAKTNINKLIKETGGEKSDLYDHLEEIIKETGYDCIKVSAKDKQVEAKNNHEKIFNELKEDSLTEKQKKGKFLAYFIEFSAKQYIACKMTGTEGKFQKVCQDLLKKAREDKDLEALAGNLEPGLNGYEESLKKNFKHVNRDSIQLVTKQGESIEDRVIRIAKNEFKGSDYEKAATMINKLVDDSKDKTKEERKSLLKESFKGIISAISKINIIPELGIISAWQKGKEYRKKSKLTSSFKTLGIKLKDEKEIVTSIVPDVRTSQASRRK